MYRKEAIQMISKLVRFEAHATFRLLVVIWAALVACSVLFSVIALLTGGDFYQNLLQSSNALYLFDKIVSSLVILLYVALFVAQIVLTLAIIVMRFYRGVLGDEGYLMHTLPIGESHIIISKGIVASIAVLGSTILGIVSILMMVFATEPHSFTEVAGEFLSAVGKKPIIILYIFEGLIVAIVSIVAGIYQVYASLAIGQIANRHRILISLGCYIGINMVISTIGVFIGTIASFTGLEDVLSNLMSHEYLGPQLIFMGLFVVSAVQLVVFHIITEYILSNKLNLL